MDQHPNARPVPRGRTPPAFIERYNRKRPHIACGGLPPMLRGVGVNNLLAHNI